MFVILNFMSSKRNQFCSHPSHPPPNNSGHTYTQQWTNFLGAHESVECKLCDILIVLQNVELQNVELQNAEFQNIELQNAELQNAELQNAELQNVENYKT